MKRRKTPQLITSTKKLERVHNDNSKCLSLTLSYPVAVQYMLSLRLEAKVVIWMWKSAKAIKKIQRQVSNRKKTMSGKPQVEGYFLCF